MGLYINPPEQSKEDWLHENGHLQLTTPEEFEENGLSVFVALIDNGIFTAAGVAYDERELTAFLRPDDRPKKWYRVIKSDLVGVCDPDELKAYFKL
tara:strand:- start:379 stop:666 length:288 start_codon:yes stop_codon:yes gene_type:complete